MYAAILVLFGIAGLVWFLAAGRHLSLAVACLMVLLVGVTFGHPFFNTDLGPLPITLDRGLWGLLMLSAVALWLLGRGQPKPLNRTDIVVLGLAVVLIFSTLSHDWRYREFTPISRLLFYNLLPVGFYFVLRHCRIQSNQLIACYWILAGFGLYLGITAICEQRGFDALVFPRYIVDPQYWEFVGRARGPFLNPVSCGIYLTVCLMATALLWPAAQPLGKALLAVAILIAGLATFLTLTRSVWLGCAFAVGLLCWFPAKPHIRGTLIVVGTLCLVVASLIFADRINRFQRDKDVPAAAMAESVALRPMLAHVALRMACDKPLLGHGFGQYTAAKKPYHFNETDGLPLSRVLPYMQHNVFLSYLTETGIVGLLLLIAILGILVHHSWRLWQATFLTAAERQFGLLGLGLVATYTINGMFHDVSIIPHLQALLFVVLGISDNLFTTRLESVSHRLSLPSGDQPRSLAA